jgi:hypothetical protein
MLSFITKAGCAASRFTLHVRPSAAHYNAPRFKKLQIKHADAAALPSALILLRQ